MKILIDLPEAKIEQIMKFKYPTIVEKAIQNGTILPDDWYELKIGFSDSKNEAESFHEHETHTVVMGKKDDCIVIRNNKGTLFKGKVSDFCRLIDKALGTVEGSENSGLVIIDDLMKGDKSEKK